jgi:hypothetical protein
MTIGSIRSLIMKKILSVLILTGFVSCTSAVASPFNFLGPTNEGSRDFAPLMQYQFEKQETLDFSNNPEEYKQKRETKNRYLDYQEGKVDLTPDVKTQYNLNNSAPGTNNLQFIKGDDGQIRIKGF